MTREETRLLAIFKNMTEAEKQEVLAFTKFVLKRQEQGLTVSDEEAAQMLKVAKERIAQAERLTA